MTRLALIAPLGILFAWSGSWTCGSYTLPDGGTSPFNPNPGLTSGGTGGGGGVTAQDASVVYDPDSGSQFGVMAGPDGGVTVGVAASFSSNFVYMSNSGDGTISRIEIPTAGAPYERARYFSIVPVDNHNINVSGIWGGELNQGGAISPSRTLVDRSGNVWVALRAPGEQAGITEIVDVGDSIAQCTPRCHQRNLLKPGQTFTEGVPLNLSAGGTVTLSPPTVIRANSTYARTYYCEDVGSDGTHGNDANDPRNYDDCLKMSIPLGDPTPDPNADPLNLTRGTSFGRAAAMSPNCNPATEQCDVWLGMWNGAADVHLGYSSPYVGGAPYDVVAVHPTGVNPYGMTVDCAGIVWSGPVADGTLAAVTTVPLNDVDAGLSIPGDVVLTNFHGFQGIPNRSTCQQYGISSDIKERIWIASWGAGPYACSFNAGALLNDYAAYMDGGLSNAQIDADLSAAWHTYSLPGTYGGMGRGINTDKDANVFEAFYSAANDGAHATSFNPDIVGGVACGSPNAGGAPCPNGKLNWDVNHGSGKGPVGIDLDANGNAWVGNYDGASAIEFLGTTGAFQYEVPIGNNVYSYSDFSGYALRNITLASGLVTQQFNGCGSGPEFTQWQELTYGVTTPPGTDVEIQVLATNSLNPAVLATETPITVCKSVQDGNCTAGVCTPCGNPINLHNYDVPAGEYLLVDVVLFPKICSQNGGASSQGKPTLWSLSVTKNCGSN
ncbi:MAG TPA: hypothetical protein VMB50_04600 [Myxococcales bacterium]|nr:hypothetical protein [Myxococcales bacterium]